MKEKDLIKQLFIDIKNGKMDSFSMFYYHTKKPVYFVIAPIFKEQMVIEDLMQETYLSFLDNIKKIDEDNDPVGYLVMIARNKSLNYLKKIKKENQFTEFQEEFGLFTMDNHVDSLLTSIKEILNEKEYMIFVLKVLGDYTFKEIAKIVNLPLGTCTWLYQEARKKAKEVL